MSDQLTLAEALKTQGQAAAESAASTEWKERWAAAIAELAAQRGLDGEGRHFTAEDVRALAGPPLDHPNAAGSLFTRAARAGLIESVGWIRSTRATLHRHPLAVWRGTAKAREEAA